MSIVFRQAENGQLHTPASDAHLTMTHPLQSSDALGRTLESLRTAPSPLVAATAARDECSRDKAKFEAALENMRVRDSLGVLAAIKQAPAPSHALLLTCCGYTPMQRQYAECTDEVCAHAIHVVARNTLLRGRRRPRSHVHARWRSARRS
jgi:hypothetical protein